MSSARTFPIAGRLQPSRSWPSQRRSQPALRSRRARPAPRLLERHRPGLATPDRPLRRRRRLDEPKPLVSQERRRFRSSCTTCSEILPERAVSTALRLGRRFRRADAWLARHEYTAVTLRSVWDHWQGRASLPPRPVVVSFDDGYRASRTRVPYAARPRLARRAQSGRQEPVHPRRNQRTTGAG